MNDCTFDPEKHEYRINGRRVEGVTQVLRDILPGWKASEFFLGKGRAVHAAAAFVARGIAFEHDPRISGQVEAVRKFFREVKPTVIAVEQPVYSTRYLYGGTLDAVLIIDRSLVVDYKAHVTKATVYQCAAYSLALPKFVRHGIGIEFHDDGTYKMPDEIWDLKRPAQEWLAMLTTFRIRERLGCLNKEEEDHE